MRTMSQVSWHSGISDEVEVALASPALVTVGGTVAFAVQAIFVSLI